MEYTDHFSTKVTPQNEPIPGKPMVANSGGGFSFAVDKWTRLHRFLILGAEGGTYYVKEKELTVENANAVLECIKEDGLRVVKEIIDISVEGRAPKNDAAIFALALAATFGDPETKRLSYAAIKKVCRIGTHLFTFCQNIQKLRGWSRGLRNGVAGFYQAKTTDDAVYQLLKYRQRNGWTHRDVLRLAHVKAPTPELNRVFQWAVGKEPKPGTVAPVLPTKLLAFEHIQRETLTPAGTAELMRMHNLPWECIPTTLHKHAEVWEAILPTMPLGALVRNLGRLSSLGLLKSNLDAHSPLVAKRLTNGEAIKKARLHPLAILNALKVYEQGHGDKGSMSWKAVPCIVDALNDAFSIAFQAITPTGKRLLLGLDVSGSMQGNMIAGTALDARTAAAAMAIVTSKVEPHHDFIAFSKGILPFQLSTKSTLGMLINEMARLDFSETDCALPMLWALQNKIPVDAFVIYTDSETNCGRIHPKQAIDMYRQKMGINTRLIVVGMCSNGFTIADPKDNGMLDVVGFDTATPNVISDFAAGNLV